MDLNINLGLVVQESIESLSEKQQLLIAPHCLWCRCRCRWRQVGGSVGHCTSSDGEAGNTCGQGLEDLCLITHNRCIAGGTLIDKDLAYHNSSHAQDEANADCEDSKHNHLPSQWTNTSTFHHSLWLSSTVIVFSALSLLSRRWASLSHRWASLFRRWAGTIMMVNIVYTPWWVVCTVLSLLFLFL